jgi:Leucine-rich repeat (LRR) protein
MSSLILSLPSDLLRFLASCLLLGNDQNNTFFKFSSDWRKFMNTRKQGLSEWKKQSQLVVLNSVYTEKFRRSALFRQRILELVESPWEQIEFHFDFSFNFESYIISVGIADIHAKTCLIKDDSLCLSTIFVESCTIAALNDCPSLQNEMIDYCQLRGNNDRRLQKSYVSQLELPISHLQGFSVYFSKEMADVSCFKNIHTLRFHDCPLITDVSNLANVYDLSLTYCAGIVDVSCLSKVHNLNLASCGNVSDVSALGNVHSLKLDYCSRVTDVSSLRNVYELSFEAFTGTSLVGLENVVKLDISCSYSISDITMLRNVEVLRIEDCLLVTNFSGLDKLESLTAGDNVDEELGTLTVSSGIESFERLETLALWGHSFEESAVTDTSQLSWNHLVNLRKLELTETKFTRFPETFLSLQSLKIVRCNELFFLPDLPASLGSLLIEDCSKLTDLHISGATRKYPIYNVEIKECLNLRRLRVSRNISSTVITGCAELLELTVLNQIGSLKTKYCSKLLYYSSYASVDCCQLNCENDNWLREYEDE